MPGTCLSPFLALLFKIFFFKENFSDIVTSHIRGQEEQYDHSQYLPQQL